MKTKVAIVGLGKMALLHASILSTIDGVEVVAFCEINSMVRRFSHKIVPGIEVVRDLADLSGKGLDAVYVTTPAPSHFPIIEAVYDGGIARHIFVEKPLASSYAQAQELCAMAESHGGINMVGYNRRFSVTFGKGKAVLDEGTLGDPTSFAGYAYSSDFCGAKVSSKASSRGGVISDLGCHVVDLALWYFGGLEVKSAEVESILGNGSQDAAYFRLASRAGTSGDISMSWCRENYRMPEIGLLVNGSKGTLKVDEDKVELQLNTGVSCLWHKHDLGDGVPFFIGGTDYVREDDIFVRSITDGVKPEPTFAAAARVEEVIQRIKHTEGNPNPK